MGAYSGDSLKPMYVWSNREGVHDLGARRVRRDAREWAHGVASGLLKERTVKHVLCNAGFTFCASA